MHLWESLDDRGELELLYSVRLGHVVPVREPLVLVSQVQRSGGTLLSQLFDAHPECHAHPSELYIGHPKKWDWPPLDLDRPEGWFETLYEAPVELHAREGYVKEKEARLVPGHRVYPFLFLPRLQKRIFDRCVEERHPATEREVLDCYFTSYFNAWLDNQNLFTGPKRAVTAFTPRLAIEPGNADRYLSAYPDGLLVSIVRDPRTWYRSARGYRDSYADPEQAAALWRESTEAALDAVARHGERVLLITYEDLVRRTEETMAVVAERIGISMSSVLLEPTFNGRPIAANSSERGTAYGIVAERASVDDSDDAIATVGELAGDLYERAAAAAR